MPDFAPILGPGGQKCPTKGRVKGSQISYIHLLCMNLKGDYLHILNPRTSCVQKLLNPPADLLAL